MKTTEIKCHFHHITSRVYTVNTVYDFDVDLDHLADHLCVRFLFQNVCDLGI